jgi:hypothetical protein
MNLGVGGQLRAGFFDSPFEPAGAGGTFAESPQGGFGHSTPMTGGGSGKLQQHQYGVGVGVAGVLFLMFIRWSLPK